jgi:hypothetical protein
LEVVAMSSKDPPGIPKNFRCPQDLLALIEKDCDREKKPFSKVVKERLWLTYSDDYDFAGRAVENYNSQIKVLEDAKVFYEEIQLKEEKRQQAAKEEAKRRELEEAEATEADKKARIINDTRLLQDHVEGRLQLWVKDDVPMDFMYFDGEPNPNYRKLPRGQLNNELQQFYNDNFHLLV